MQKLKVGLVLDDSLDRGDGVQQYVKTLGRWLAEQNHDVHYLVGQSTSDTASVHSLARNISVRFNGNRMTIPLPGRGGELRELIAREKFDILHVQTPYSPFMSGKAISSAVAETAVVGTFHILPYGRLHTVGSRALAALQKRSLKRFDAICSVSPAAAKFASIHFGVESEVIPCMIPIGKWKTDTRNQPGRVVFLGRLVKRKGGLELLKALNLLKNEYDINLDVVIAGDGPERRQLEAYAVAHHLPVRFLGYVPEDDKPSLLASAELAVFPAISGESFGIVLVEAMAAGAGVVVGGNNPGYKSVLGDWPEVLVDAKNTSDFSKSLARLLTDKQLAARLHQKQQKSSSQYDVQNVGRRILSLYERALLHRRQEMR